MTPPGGAVFHTGFGAGRIVSNDGDTVAIDARPSDAIALALRTLGAQRYYFHSDYEGALEQLGRALELLEDEIRIAMGLLGVHSLDMLDGSYLHPAPAVTPPHVTSAFPLLDLDDRRY
jgi:glycolate oxidase